MITREGCYGIVIKDDQILLIENNQQYFLPGGGIEAYDVDNIACLSREFIEECGADIDGIHFFGRFESHFFSTSYNDDMHWIGNFYEIKSVSFTQERFEKDEHPVWLPFNQEIIETLFVAAQKDALIAYSHKKII